MGLRSGGGPCQTPNMSLTGVVVVSKRTLRASRMVSRLSVSQRRMSKVPVSACSIFSPSCSALAVARSSSAPAPTKVRTMSPRYRVPMALSLNVRGRGVCVDRGENVVVLADGHERHEDGALGQGDLGRTARQVDHRCRVEGVPVHSDHHLLVVGRGHVPVVEEGGQAPRHHGVLAQLCCLLLGCAGELLEVGVGLGPREVVHGHDRIRPAPPSETVALPPLKPGRVGELVCRAGEEGGGGKEELEEPHALQSASPAAVCLKCEVQELWGEGNAHLLQPPSVP
mmetsp:Transcript_714/g.2379  ORF Transcript_714/g.2379 Transcript_714/m.2379 type:complete len:283 (-) Transcript_714:1317-2165(-)